MKTARPLILLALLAVIGCSRSQQAELRYELSYDASAQRINVTMQYQPSGNVSVSFTYGAPEFGGQYDIFDCFQLESVSAKYTLDDSLRQLTLYPQDDTPVEVRYSVIDHNSNGNFMSELFRPVLRDDYLYCASLNLLLLPDDGDIPVKLRWTENEPFHIASYIDPNLQDGQWWQGKVDDLRISLFVGGTQVAVEPCKAGSADGYVITELPDSLRFNALLIKDFFVKYFATCREFWQDTAWEEYSLAVLPFLDEKTGHDIGGIGYQKGFCAKYCPVIDSVLNETNMFTIAHEIGHHWIGDVLVTDVENQWFGEGFNDYQTYYNLSHCGLMSADWFERSFNREMEIYYTSPISTLPNEEVWKNYWTMGDYNPLPYRRGCIFAFFLDNQIRLATEGCDDFMSLMRTLKQAAESKGDGSLDVEGFIQATAQYLPEDEVRKYVEDYIIQGQFIDFSQVQLAKEFDITIVESVPVVKVLGEAY